MERSSNDVTQAQPTPHSQSTNCPRIQSKMETHEERCHSASNPGAFQSLNSPPPPPPPVAPPPLIPLLPCQPPPSPCEAAQVPATGPNSINTALEGSALPEKDETCRGVQKLLKWGICSQDDGTVWIASYRHTVPILQQGPECGIVALCMAVNMLEMSPSVTANKNQILKVAQEKGFTIQGEMFSAKNMLDLVASVYGVHGVVLQGKMTDNRDAILSHLASGLPVLVPYDKDGNCEPCCRRGHKAHWAVLTGFILQGQRQNLPDPCPPQWQPDAEMPNLYHLAAISSSSSQQIESLTQTLGRILQAVPASSTYVLARQGKSTQVHPWSFATLSSSNSNLCELGGKIEDYIDMFVIPEGGIQAGLCSRVVLIRP